MFPETKKQSIHQDNIIICTKNRALKYMRQKLTQLKRETDIQTIKVGTTRLNISEEIEVYTHQTNYS